MKKFFKATGLWYLPEDPGNRLTGTLDFSAKGLLLTLSGQFQEGWSPDVERYPLLYGIIDKSPYGEFVTLFDGIVRSQTFRSAGIGSTQVRCQSAFIGNEPVTDKQAEANSLDITTTYLTDWIEEKNLFVWKFDKEEISISYKHPLTVSLPIDGGKVDVGFTINSKSSRCRASVFYESHLMVSPSSPQEGSEVLRRYCQPFQNLLTFATDTPNALVSILARHGSFKDGDVPVAKKAHYIYDAIFRVERKKDRLLPEDMVFTFHEAQAAGVNIFKKWLEFCTNYEAFCSVYFATQYAPPKYLEEKFMRLVSALSLLQPSDYEATPTAKAVLAEINNLLEARFDQDNRGFFRSVVPSGLELNMPGQLYSWLKLYADIMSQIVGDDFAEFVRSVVDTINYTKRPVATEGERPFKGGELHYAIQKIRTLINIVILMKLGFDDSYIKLFIERNTYFQHMKSLIQQGDGA